MFKWIPRFRKKDSEEKKDRKSLMPKKTEKKTVQTSRHSSPGHGTGKPIEEHLDKQINDDSLGEELHDKSQQRQRIEEGLEEGAFNESLERKKNDDRPEQEIKNGRNDESLHQQIKDESPRRQKRIQNSGQQSSDERPGQLEADESTSHQRTENIKKKEHRKHKRKKQSPMLPSNEVSSLQEEVHTSIDQSPSTSIPLPKPDILQETQVPKKRAKTKKLEPEERTIELLKSRSEYVLMMPLVRPRQATGAHSTNADDFEGESCTEDFYEHNSYEPSSSLTYSQGQDAKGSPECSLRGSQVDHLSSQDSVEEELQATLHELVDMRSQVVELHLACARVQEEKHVLLESLCHQTDKLDHAKKKMDALQNLLKEQEKETDTEKGQNFMAYLKRSQEEKEALLLRQEELKKLLNECKVNATSDLEASTLKEEKISTLESAQSALKAERDQLDGELTTSKEDNSSLTIEVNRLNTLLDHAKAKICDLEQTRDLTDKSELEEVIDMSRKEKDNLETQVAYLQEKLSKALCEISKLTDQLEKVQEELKVARNNAKHTVSNAEFKMGLMEIEYARFADELQAALVSNNDLKVQLNHCQDEKKLLESLLTETQTSLASSESKLREMERAITEETDAHTAKNLEWEQFQNDLLVSVRVANDLKTEAMTKVDALIEENERLTERLKLLEGAIDKRKANSSSSALPSSGLTLTEVRLDFPSRRSKLLSRHDSRISVKSLIESIEKTNKQKSLDAENDPIPNSNANSEHQEPIYSLSLADPSPDVVDSDEGTHINRASVLDLERRSISADLAEKDPLLRLAQHGSKRNALLKWCQTRTIGYRGIDITNFSTSWSDGLALCALLHTYLSDEVPFHTLTSNDKHRNFTVAFAAAENHGIPTTLNMDEMIQKEKPEWKKVMDYVTSIYKNFES